MIAVGGLIMATALVLYAGTLGGALLVGRSAVPSATAAPPMLSTPGAAALRQAALSGPLSVAVLVAAMYVMTVVAFELSRALPLLATGGGH